MPELPRSFPFPSRRLMLLNGLLYVLFTMAIPIQVGMQLLSVRWTDVSGLALWLCAIVNGVMAVFWLRHFVTLRRQLSSP